MAKDIEFAAGLWFNEPHQNAPEYVLGRISIRPAEFTDWLRQQPQDDKGYVQLKVNRSQKGSVYVALDDWKPQAKGRDDGRRGQDYDEGDRQPDPSARSNTRW